MQVKNIWRKTLFILCLTVAIGISSTACSEGPEQGIPENTEGINEKSTITLNNSVKDNKVPEANIVSESTSSVEEKTSSASDKAEKSVAQLNAAPQPSQKAGTVHELNASAKGDVQLNEETALPQDLSQKENPSPVPNIEPQLTSEPQTSAAPDPTPAPAIPSDRLAKPTLPPSRQISKDEIIAYATNFLGVRYLWGGTSPVDTNPDPNIDNSGFSDNGYVQYVFAHFNIAVGLNRSEQIKAGTEVSKEELQAGDIVFFGKSLSSLSHVGIYIDNNAYIHSPCTPGDVVKISPFTRTDFIAARRVIK